MRPTEPHVIDLGDGVKRELLFTLGTLRRMKKALGKSFLNGEALGGIDEDVLPVMIEHGLVNKDLTADQVSDLIWTPDLPRVMNELMVAYIGQSPDSDGTEKN